MVAKDPTKSKSGIVRYSHTVGLCVMQDRGFMFPVDTLISDDGRMHTVSRAYVAAAAQLRVTVYNSDSEYFGVYGGFGEEKGQFKWPSAITSDSHGRIYISDEQCSRINIYESDGTPVGHWGITGTNDGELQGPSGICFDSEDNLLVSDHLNNRVQKFSKDGSFLASFGQDEGSGLKLPWGITIGNDQNIYVADWGNHCIKKYSPNGNLLSKFGSFGKEDGQFRNPSSVAVDSTGYIYVADWGNERVQILDTKGSFLTKLRGEATLSVWGKEYLDSNYEEAEPRSRSNLEPGTAMFGGDPHEESAHIEKYFWGPTSIKIDREDRLYVTESNRHRVQIYEKI